MCPPRFVCSVYLRRSSRHARKSRFASVGRNASVSNCCLSASRSFPAFARLGGLRLGGLLFRGHDHYHVASVQVGLALYATESVEVAREPPQQSLSELGMLHLAPAEHDRDLHFVAASKKAFDVAAFGVEVVVAYLGPELYLPHVDVYLLFAGRLTGLFFLVFELAVVHHADHGRVGVRGYLHEVEVGPLAVIHGLADVLDAKLFSVGRDQTHLARPDLTVNSGLFFSRYCAPLLSKSSFRGRSSPTDD